MTGDGSFVWANCTVFDRAASALQLAEVRRLRLDDQDVIEAADLLGIT